MKIELSNIEEVLNFRNSLVELRSPKQKRKQFVEGVLKLPEESEWLLTFACWFCLSNFRFKAIDESRYHSVPEREISEANFGGFLEVVRFFNRKTVTCTRESELIRFLAKTSRSDREFYLSLVSKSFTKGLPVMEIQTSLDLGVVNTFEIYKAPEALQTSFAALNYPVAISAVMADDMRLGVVSREPRSSRSFMCDAGKLIPVKPLLPVDLQYIGTPRFTLTGYAGRLSSGRIVFHPVDYFDNLKEFALTLNGNPTTPFPERVEKLRKFQDNNLLTQITPNYVGLAFREEEVLGEVVKVMEHSDCEYLTLTDQDTARTGESHLVEVRVTVGIVERFWHVGGNAKGFLVWFNGDLFRVAFSFAGRDNALLNNIKPVKGKLLEFLYLKVGGTKIGVGRKILWDKAPWRRYRLHGKHTRVEKCTLCGGTNAPPHGAGICSICDKSMRYYFSHNGVGNWIVAKGVMTKKRRKSSWEPEMLEMVPYHYKGHRIEAREDGCWRFLPVETEKGEEDESGSDEEECGFQADHGELRD